MKFRLTVLIVFSLCLSNVFADEGMWLLGNLRKNKQTDRVIMGHRTKRILRIERKEYQTY